ncbi:esterase/lipase family protein [Streptomyces sp. NPDC048604]|uniref:esterase/lipase family protein n=1 Tax=Streptomyces sp. NPDC048604 TaxID=3365578 RepID=UPI00371BC6E3
MERLDPVNPPAVGNAATHDAVVVIPGIMGSELVDTESGDVLWGMRTALAYSARWHHKRGMAALAVREDERAGRTGRITARRLLKFASWSPLLGGVEPYTDLVRGITPAVAHPAAICEFAYDWRLPVAYNARLLADAIDRHLQAWTALPEYTAARRHDPDGRPAEVVLVAHSMGGLLVRELTRIPGAMDRVRATLTLGTPFHGAVKAAAILNSGRGAPVPLPHRQLRDLARTLPGLHDLLPAYRCVETDDDMVAPTPADIAALGGDAELAAASLDRTAALRSVRIPDHVKVVGIAQHTMQSMRLKDGVVIPQPYVFRRHPDDSVVRDAIGRPLTDDCGGDGTVYRYAGHVHGVEEGGTYAQQHGALATCGSAVDRARGLLTGLRRLEDLGQRLGDGETGLEAPDLVGVHEEFEITVTGEADPRRLTCRIQDTGDADRVVDAPRLPPRRDSSGELRVRCRLREPGLYRIKVSGGSEPVTRLVMAAAEDPDLGG